MLSHNYSLIVPDTSRINIAPYGEVSQSHARWGMPCKAIDGWTFNTDDRSCATTQPQLHSYQNTTNVTAWWSLDLKQTVTVSLVRLTNIQGPGKSLLCPFYIRPSTVSLQWNLI